MLKEALRDGVHCWRNEIVTCSVALFKRIMLPWGHVARPLFDGLATWPHLKRFILFICSLLRSLIFFRVFMFCASRLPLNLLNRPNGKKGKKSTKGNIGKIVNFSFFLLCLFYFFQVPYFPFFLFICLLLL